ncbi:MAG: alpha/beta hydrolase [Pseudomonadota bacterium]
MLLLHSINAAPSAYEMGPFVTSMSLDRPLFVPDLPGFGRSQRGDRAYTAEFFATAVIEIIAKIGGGSVDVVALSTTAELVARAALKRPDLFSSLTLISPTGFSRRRPGPNATGDRARQILSAPVLGASLFRLLRSRTSVRWFLNMAFREKAPDAMVDYACATAAQPGASFAPFYFLSGALFAADAVGELYEPLELPVLVLYDRDPNISFDYLSDVESLPNWTLVRIPKTHGLPQFQEPELTEQAIVEFWSTLD